MDMDHEKTKGGFFEMKMGKKGGPGKKEWILVLKRKGEGRG